jgi:predicted DNA-binding transcriptional regulator AlpA
MARRLHISVRTLYRMVRRGQVPQPIRFNRKLVRWRDSDYEQCLEAVEKLLRKREI